MTTSVEISFRDSSSLTVKEIISSAKSLYGATAQVRVKPAGDSPESHIYFGVQQLITEKQVSSFFEDGTILYQKRLEELRREVLEEVNDLISQVIIDNEGKIVQE